MRTVTCLICCLLTVTCLRAELSPETRTALDELFEVMQFENQMMTGFEAMLPMIDQMAAQMQLDEAGTKELTDIYRNWFKDDLDHAAMRIKFTELYAKTFTLDEIKELTAFYQTPLGKKFLATMPELTSEGARIGMEEATLKQGKLIERLQPFMEKHRR